MRPFNPTKWNFWMANDFCEATRESVKNGTLELPAAISLSTLITSNRIREQDEAIQPYQVEFLDDERLLRSN
ncbi:hypothetical protein M3231_14405 [Neobacillus mesonae]|nr:hypothetical protein [Neobacillus mesonae]